MWGQATRPNHGLQTKMNPKQSDKKIDKIVGLIETLDYSFFSSDNEDSAMRSLTTSIIGLEEYQSIIERDDAIKQLKKG